MIAIHSVDFSLQERPILSNVTLEISEKRVGLIGCNGSGKTSLLRMIAGLQEPDKGYVKIKGVDVAKDRQQAISTVGLIFQNPDHQIIFPTVEEEIAFGLESQLGDKAEAIRKANEILEAFGRSHWAALGTHMLSQGQRHLVCLMSVLAMKPSVILLDEPYAGLDWPTSSALYQWLEGLDQQIVLITHDLEHLRNFDRIIWLDDGKLAMDGTPETVLTAYVKEMKLRGYSDLTPETMQRSEISKLGA